MTGLLTIDLTDIRAFAYCRTMTTCPVLAHRSTPPVVHPASDRAQGLTLLGRKAGPGDRRASGVSARSIVVAASQLAII